jgi:phenylpropionate dioxygenase-like ring-hydroxylating dioxygenase large terminal subunit
MNSIAKWGMLTRSQCAMIDAIPDHGETSVSVGHATISTSEYVDPARFEEEKTKLFFKKPVIAGLSNQVPKAGTHFQVSLLGVPVLVTRARDNVVRAFLNVCKHRGTILCPEKGAASEPRLVCPYHAWTYSLEGRLVGVPRADTFQDLDKSAYGLTALSCMESGGFIWVGLKAGEKLDFLSIKGEIAEDLDALKLADTAIFTSKTYSVSANWKLIMDTMLDGYHITRLHRNSVGRYFVDAPTLFESVGPHLRSMAGRGNFDRGKAQSYELESVRRVVGITYILFPNGVVVLSPDYINVAILRPVSFSSTEVDYYMVTNPLEGRADREGMEDKLRRSFQLMDVVFGQEDFWAASLGQEGLATRAVENVLLGGMEMQMKTFHDSINKQMV